MFTNASLLPALLMLSVAACTLYGPGDGGDGPNPSYPGPYPDGGYQPLPDAGYWTPDDAGGYFEDADVWTDDAGSPHLTQEAICVVTAGCLPFYVGVGCILRCQRLRV